jgi:hypothetical protein
MVSLIDSDRQYILAEATRTLSLLGHSAEKPEDEVWLGNTIIARNDAVCYHCFNSTYTALEQNGDEYKTKCMVISDCREDPRFADRDYVTGEPGVRFYAGVPITTKSGYQIGVYAVSDEKPRHGLSANDVRFMEDVAAAVMEHLELAKKADDRHNGERMVRGLAEFIERSSSLEARSDSSNRTTMEKQTENARQAALPDDTPEDNVPTTTAKQTRKRESERGSDASRIFQRAARIIRQSTHAEGAVFFDTSAAGIKGHVFENLSPVASGDESSTSSTTDVHTADSGATNRRRRREVDSKPLMKMSGPSTTPEHGGEASSAQSKPCPVLGFSARSNDTALSEASFIFSEATLERYINRYPHGKFFNFNEDGIGINSSDERSERSETEHSDNRGDPATTPRGSRKKKDRFVPTEFFNILPKVCSLIFLPLWDQASERWIAGGFIWTSVAGRLISPENELPYLKAFGNSITSEIIRVKAQKADRAKTTFIASISHELRSPLHGILGSVEFLHDTVSSSYQESLVSSIETCGRTLLDTIDHVLGT